MPRLYNIEVYAVSVLMYKYCFCGEQSYKMCHRREWPACNTKCMSNLW